MQNGVQKGEQNGVPNRVGNDRDDGPAADAIETAAVVDLVPLLAGSELFETTGDPRLHVPRLRVLDGPAGVRGTEFVEHPSLAVPSPSALGALWDRVAVAEVGELLGRQLRAKGASVHLAPTLNLHRTPVGGRNFESFGEDPYLVSELGVAYIRGVRLGGDGRVSSCPKHFVGNDAETDRTTVDVVVDERTLHEVYLRPFRAAIAAGVEAVMVGYNQVNGTPMVEQRELIDEVLRSDWGFDGIVMSDWYGTTSTIEPLLAGVDLEMPGPSQQRGPLLAEEVRRGAVGDEVVRRSARRIGAVARKLAGDDERPPAETTRADAADRRVLRRITAQAMTLVRNEPCTPAAGGHGSVAQRVLPLSVSDDARIAVLGAAARYPTIGGGGSAMVRPIEPSSPLVAMRETFGTDRVIYSPGSPPPRELLDLDVELCEQPVVELFSDPDGAFDPAAIADRTTATATGRLLWFRDPLDASHAPRFSARLRTTLRADRSGTWTIGFRSIGDGRLRIDDEVALDNSHVGLDGIAALGKPEERTEIDLVEGQEVDLEFALRRVAEDGLGGLIVGIGPPHPVDPIAEAVAVARDADVAVVVVGNSSDTETEGRDRAGLALRPEDDALVEAVAATGTPTVAVVNVGAPVLMPWFDRVAAVLVSWFPGEAFGEALVDVLTGGVEPQGRLPTTFPAALADTPTAATHPPVDGVARYDEGRLVGYRWYDRHDIEPFLPFGFGLGYADIDVVDARVEGQTIVATVRNRSDRSGTTTVQVYAAFDRSATRDTSAAGPVRDDEPVRRLAGFGRVEVGPSATAHVTVDVDPAVTNTWDVETHRWATIGAPIVWHVGTSSRHLPIVRRARDGHIPGDTERTTSSR